MPTLTPTNPFSRPVKNAPPPMEPIGVMIRSAWSWYNVHFKNLLGIGLITYTPLLIASIASQFFLYYLSLIQVGQSSQVPKIFLDLWHKDFGTAMNITVLVGTLLLLLALVGWSLWGTVTLYTYVVQGNSSLRPWAAFTAARDNFWPYTGTSMLLGFIIVGGLIVLLIPGIYWAALYCLAPIITIIEGRRTPAFHRSKELVTGYWWAVAARNFMMGLTVVAVAGVLGFAIGIVTGALSTWHSQFALLAQPLGNFIGSIAGAPASAIMMYLIYVNLKKLKGSS